MPQNLYHETVLIVFLYLIIKHSPDLNYHFCKRLVKLRNAPMLRKWPVLINFKTCVCTSVLSLVPLLPLLPLLAPLHTTSIVHTTPITPNSHDAPTIVNTSPNLPTTPTSPTNMKCNSYVPPLCTYLANSHTTPTTSTFYGHNRLPAFLNTEQLFRLDCLVLKCLKIDDLNFESLT